MGRIAKKLLFFLALLCLLPLTACETETDQDPPPDDPTRGVTFSVDSSLDTGLDDLDGKPLTGLLDETGRQVDFIADELIVVGDDHLNDLLDRWDAELISTADFAAISDSIDSVHRVQVDPNDGDIDALHELFKQHDETYFGHFDATDEAALGLLAIAMEELVLHDVQVTINPYLPFLDDDDGDDPGTEPGDPLAYVDDLLVAADENNPAEWTHLTSSEQDIAVTEAWKAIAMAGLADPDDPMDRIRIMILDGGFLELDLTEGSYSPFYGQSNFGDCGTPCPWHGIAVAQVATADPHSGKGVIGTGSPLANATLLGVPGDVQSALEQIADDIQSANTDDLSPTRIINMSFGLNVHWTLSSVLYPLANSIFTGLQDELDVLIIAAAGNDGDHLHEKSCAFGNCWDTHKYLPCQAQGVLCVGGLDVDSLEEHENSNFGDDAELWAPFTVRTSLDATASDPDTSLNEVYSSSGTSYSAPFVAGIAALVMAADPSLSATEVRDLLFDTARTGEGEAGLVVQARDAVHAALGGAPFQMDFETPDEGQLIPRGDFIRPRLDLTAGGFLPHDISWTFLDEPVDGFGASATMGGDDTLDLPLGPQEIHVTVSAGPYELTRTLTIELVNRPPELTLLSPFSDEVYYESSTIPLFASTSDRDSPGGTLDDSQVTWTNAATGDLIGSGHQLLLAGHDFGVGDSTIEVTADDGHDAVSETISFTVEEDPDVVPPSAVITAPEDGAFLGWANDSGDGYLFGYEVTFEGQAFYAGEALSDLVWHTTADKGNSGNHTTRQIGTGTSFTTDLYADDGNCSATVDHLIELTATNDEGISHTTSVTVTVGGVVC